MNMMPKELPNVMNDMRYPKDARDFAKKIMECKGIIGRVVIADCIKNHPSVWAEKGVWN